MVWHSAVVKINLAYLKQTGFLVKYIIADNTTKTISTLLFYMMPTIYRDTVLVKTINTNLYNRMD